MNSSVSRIKKTILEMLEARCYKITNTINDEKNPEDSKIVCVKNNKEIVYVFTHIIEKLNTNIIHYYFAKLQNDDVKHGILIYKNKTNIDKHILETCCKIEYFEEQELMFNITEHVLVPKHRKLSESEKEKFFSKHGKNIQIMLKIDPVARFYLFEPGDVIEIIRRDNVIAYRIVK
jgi:DNA-directed RNA polymerase I, II, and III subunit RPABC1